MNFLNHNTVYTKGRMYTLRDTMPGSPAPFAMTNDEGFSRHYWDDEAMFGAHFVPAYSNDSPLVRNKAAFLTGTK